MSGPHAIGLPLTALIALLPMAELQDPRDKTAKPIQKPKQQKPAPTTGTPQSKPTTPAPETQALLVIVNAKNPEKDLSMTELRSYFKKERRFWPDGTRTLLCLRPTASAEMKTLLAEVYQWTPKRLRRHWKSKSFRGDITSGKAYTVVPTAANAIARAKADPAAITVVLAADLPADATGVRVLTIDGKPHTDAGYPLLTQAPATPDS